MKHLVLYAFCLFGLPLLYAQGPLLSSSPAYAASQGFPSGKEGVFKEQLEGFLEAQRESARKNGCSLSLSGGVEMETAKDYYAFTLPTLVYTDSLQIRSQIGMLAINAAPKDPDLWGLSLAFPTPIPSYNKDGKMIFRTEIGSQNGHGLWHERLGHFVALDYTMSQIKFSDFVQNRTLTIGSTAIFSLLKEQDEGIFTGKGSVTAKDIIFSSSSKENIPVTITFPQIVFEAPLSGRAAKSPLTKAEMQSRFSEQVPSFPDGMNLLSQILGQPETITAHITGIEAAANRLQQAMPSAPQSEQEDYMRAVLGLKTLSAIGLPAANNDPLTRRYELVFAPDGRFLVNGMDFSALFAASALLSGASAGVIK